MDLPFEQYVQQNTYVDCTNNNKVSANLQDSIKLLQIAPDGTTTEKSLVTKNSSYIFDTSTVDVATWPHYLRPTEAVPDNDDGFLVEYADFVATYDAQYSNLYAQMYLLHTPSSGEPSTFALPYDSHAHSPIMVGQNGIVYMGNLATTIGFDYINGSLKWEVPLGGTWIDPVFAGLDDNQHDQFLGVMANSVVRVSDQGNLTYDGWVGSSATQSLVSAYGPSRSLDRLDYTLPLAWTAFSGNDVVQLNGSSVAPAAGNWNKANQDRERLSAPFLMLRAFQDCITRNTGSNPDVRRPRYELVDSKLRSLNDPTRQDKKYYTVYEFLSPYRFPASCRDENQNYTGISPCQPADGTIQNPYNEFHDNIAGAFGAKEFVNHQSFFVGLGNERRWTIPSILVTTSVSPLKTQLKSPSWFNEILSRFRDPLIDNHSTPYLAPWDGQATTCDRTGDIW